MPEGILGSVKVLCSGKAKVALYIRTSLSSIDIGLFPDKSVNSRVILNSWSLFYFNEV